MCIMTEPSTKEVGFQPTVYTMRYYAIMPEHQAYALCTFQDGVANRPDRQDLVLLQSTA